jgi:site-specific DNA-methyltransferase (adenine-specific)
VIIVDLKTVVRNTKKESLVVKIGNVWNNKVICGDCLEVMPQIPDGSIDMVLCDLPYGMTSNKWDSEIPLDKLWKQYKRIIKENGVIALTASQPFTSTLVMSNLEMYRHQWIWYKDRGSNFANTVREPMKEHESVLIFSNGKWVYNKQREPRKGTGLQRAQQSFHWKPRSENYRVMEDKKAERISDLRVPSSVQFFKVERGLHPTQKPVKLFEYLIKTYTNEGDVVLDNCIGSGTTAIACINTNRKFIGIELEEKYYKMTLKRISETPRDLKSMIVVSKQSGAEE